MGKQYREIKSVTLGIVDNDAMALQALDILIRRQHSPLDIIWTCTSGKDALLYCKEIEIPNVVLLDIELEDLNGMTLSQHIHELYPTVATVGITAFPIPTNNAQIKNAHFSDIVHKDIAIEKLLQTLGKAVNNHILSRWTSSDQASPLSNMELEIIRQSARGLTYAVMARKLGISEQTAKTYARRAYEKLGVHSRAEAVARCAEEGLLI